MPMHFLLMAFIVYLKWTILVKSCFHLRLFNSWKEKEIEWTSFDRPKCSTAQSLLPFYCCRWRNNNIWYTVAWRHSEQPPSLTLCPIIFFLAVLTVRLNNRSKGYVPYFYSWSPCEGFSPHNNSLACSLMCLESLNLFQLHTSYVKHTCTVYH